MPKNQVMRLKDAHLRGYILTQEYQKLLSSGYTMQSRVTVMVPDEEPKVEKKSKKENKV